MTVFRLLLAVLAVLLPVMAQAQAPARLTGTIAAVAGDRVSVRTEDNETVPVLLTPGTRYGSVRDRTLADIKPGSFVGSAAIRGRDGVLHAQEVHIFPESMRGTGEGHRPMDQPGQTMTNAAVDGIASAADGRTLTLRYEGGSQQIAVAPDTRIVELVPGDRGLLVAGAAVTVRGTKAADGTVSAVSIQAEKDGVKPLP